MPLDSKKTFPLRRLFDYLRQSVISYLQPDKPQNKTTTNTVAPVAPTCQKPSSDTPGLSTEKELFVVWDAIGDGRLVGVFADEALVKDILAISPFYYRSYQCHLGQPTPLALHWLDDSQRQALESLLNITDFKPAPQEKKSCNGQIRPATPEDFDRMVEIWLQASLIANNFVNSSFWQNNSEQLRNHFLPASENWVYCENSCTEAFLSLKHDNLAALFVAPALQGRGIGRMLLEHAKSLRQSMTLAVFEANSRSVRFYTRNGFAVVQSQKDPQSGHNELIMHYTAQDQRK